MKFRKKPVVIEAIRASDLLGPMSSDSVAERTAAAARAPQWMREALSSGHVQICSDGLLIVTREGDMIAGHDDWIIRGIKGELYPCKPDIFAATYDEVQ